MRCNLDPTSDSYFHLNFEHEGPILRDVVGPVGMQPYELHTVDIVGSKRLKRDEAKYTPRFHKSSPQNRGDRFLA